MEGSGLLFIPGPPGPEGPQVGLFLPFPSSPSCSSWGISCHHVPCHHPVFTILLLLAGCAGTARDEGEELFLPASIHVGCLQAACRDASDTSFLAGRAWQPWTAWLARTKGRSPERLGWLCPSTWVCRAVGRTPVLPNLGLHPVLPHSHCREMLACLAWMAALAWRASLDHR